jgi:hypothetical protein
MRSWRFLTVVWGSYTDQFLNFLIPSMLALGNLPKLREQFRIEWWIYTDEIGANKIRISPGFARLSEIARINFRLTEVSKYTSETQESRRQNKYDFCNSLYTDFLKDGVTSRAIMSWLQPDIIVSSNTFSSVSNSILNGYKVVWGAPGFRTNLADTIPLIQRSQDVNGSLTIDAADAIAFTLNNLSNWERRRNLDRYDQEHAIVNLYSIDKLFCFQFSYAGQPLAVDLSWLSGPELVDYYEGAGFEASSFFLKFTEDEQDILLNSAQALILSLEADSIFSNSSLSRPASALKPASRLKTAIFPFSHPGFVVNNYLMFRIWVYQGAAADGALKRDNSFTEDYQRMVAFRNVVQGYYYFLLKIPFVRVILRSYKRFTISLLRFALIKSLNEWRKSRIR